MSRPMLETNSHKTYKRMAYSLRTKLELLDLYHKNRSLFLETLAQKKINPTTFALWLRTEQKLRTQAQTTDITKVKRCRPSPLNFVDDGLYRWFVDARAAEPFRKITDEELLICANHILDNLIETGVIAPLRLVDLLPPLPNKHSLSSQTDGSELSQDSTTSPSENSDTAEDSVVEIVQFNHIVPGYSGVNNSGSDCYLIVIIQLLFFHPQFRKFIIATDPDVRFFPFNVDTAHKYFANTDRQQIRMGWKYTLPSLTTYTRFATINSSEVSFFNHELSRQTKSYLLQSYEALRYTFARLCRFIPLPTEPSPIELPKAISVRQTYKPTDTTSRHIESEFSEFLALAAEPPRVAQFSQATLLTFHKNPQAFALQFGPRFQVASPISLSPFKELYRDINGNPIQSGQQDPQEFLLLLLNTLTHYFYCYGLPLITRKLFWIQTTETFVCANGHEVKRTDNGAFIIQIPIQQTTSLIDSLQLLHSEGHQVFSECTQCICMGAAEAGKSVPCKSLLGFKQLPNTVFFMLERYISGSHGPTKLTKRFTYPVEDVLDLSPFSNKPLVTPTSKDYQLYCNYHHYRLAAAVCHQGEINSGHYIAFIRERHPPFRWLLINDEGIMPVPISLMTDMLFGSDRTSASPSSTVCSYLLAYDRIEPIDEWMFERSLFTKVCPSSSFHLYTFGNGENITLKAPISLPCAKDYEIEPSTTPTAFTDSNSTQKLQKQVESNTGSTSSTDSEVSTKNPTGRRDPDSPISSVISGASDSDNSVSNSFKGINPARRPVRINRSWIARWKFRHGIRYRKFYGESGESDIAAGNEWVETELAALREHFRPEDIFNADETGLFYKRLPSRGLTFKSEVIRGRRVSKSRITVLVAASSVGEKLPLLVIGRNKHQKQLAGNTLTLRYLHNSSAWMTHDIFTDWLESINARMVSARRFIAMIVDNCSAHKVTKEFSNVSLVYLPPCVTSTHQPCDAGIIALLKRKYHSTFLRILYHQRCEGKPVSVDSISFLSSLRNLEAAWSSIPAQHIENCFRHAWKKQDDKDSQPLELQDEIEPNEELGRFVTDNISALSFPRENDYTLQPVSEHRIALAIQSEVKTSQSLPPPILPIRPTQDPTQQQISEAAAVLLSGIRSGKVNSDETLASSLEEIRESASQAQEKHVTGQVTLDHFFKKLNDDKKLPTE